MRLMKNICQMSVFDLFNPLTGNVVILAKDREAYGQKPKMIDHLVKSMLSSLGF